MHFRGGHKRHLHRGRLSQAVSIGEALLAEGREVGRVLEFIRSPHGNEALLILSDSMVEQARAGIFSAFDNDLSLELEVSWPA
jgi:folate-binding Fe-S cluster repair protein YgfZ